jgi:hypothetical protein
MTIDFSFSDITSFVGSVINTVPNAILTFNTVKNNIPIDIVYLPDGNAVVPVPEYQQVNLSCYLREASFASSILETPTGVDTQTNYFVGRLINPKTYPLPLQAQGDIMAVINGQKGRVVSHRAFSTPSAKSYGYDPILGQKIALFVQFQQGVSS